MRVAGKLFTALAVAAVLISPAGASSMEERLKTAFDAGELEGLHAVLFRVENEVFHESYYRGTDESWGRPLGLRDHDPDTIHDIRSVTKSVVSLLYGIALAEGLVPDVEAPLLDQFPEYQDLPDDPRRAAMTVEDALTMRMGIEWNEMVPYTSPENSEIAMELAEDRIRFVLSRDMVGVPGTEWIYNGGATAIIGSLIARGTGRDLVDYAKEKLFGPLDIEAFEWMRGEDGVPSGASGLRLTARGVAAIGQMVANGGRVGDDQIVPAAWIERMLEPRTAAGELRYGYFWWLAPGEGEPVWVAGFGNGGQRLSINRARNIVTVILAGNYNAPDAWQLPVKVIGEFFSPSYETMLAEREAEPAPSTAD